MAVRRQPEGMGVRSSTNGNACGGNPDCYRREVPSLSDTQRAGPPLQPLSSHAGPASTGTREGSHQIRLICPCHRLLCPHLPCLGDPLTLIATSGPSYLMGSWAPATSGADCGWRKTHRGRAETTA